MHKLEHVMQMSRAYGAESIRHEGGYVHVRFWSLEGTRELGYLEARVDAERVRLGDLRHSTCARGSAWAAYMARWVGAVETALAAERKSTGTGTLLN